MQRFITINSTRSTGSTKLLELTGRTSGPELTWHTGFLVSTGRTFLEFTGLLELTVRTILLEFTEGIGLRTSAGRTLLELTRPKRLLEWTVWISTRSTRLLELTGCTSLLELTGRSGLSQLTGHIILLKLTEVHV